MRTQTEQGVTLIEMILYLAIASIVLGVLGSVYTTIITLRNKNQTIAEVEMQGQQIMQTITLAIRNAQSITAPATGASAASASLKTYTAGTTPTLFALSSGAVTMKLGSGTAIPLNGTNVSVSNLSFQNITRAGTDGILRISFTIAVPSVTGEADETASRTFYGSAAVRGVYP